MSKKKTINIKRNTNKRKGSGKKRKMSRKEIAMQQARRARTKLEKTKRWRFINLSESKRKNLKKAFLAFMLLISVVVFVGGVFFLNYLQQLSTELPDPDEPFKQKEVASVIYDRKGEELFKVFNEYNRDEVNIEEIPQEVRWAFLAAEDSEFYDHPGFDVMAIIRCGLRYLRDGYASCGGSTVTQQTLKITALYNEVGVQRKLKEILMALQVEQLYDKEQILQIYLTVAPFGSNIYGITTASEFYFGKSPADLTLAESAILASIINDPIRLSPTLSTDPEVNDKLIDRAEYVIGQVEEKQAYINEKTKQITANEDEEEKRITEDFITEDIINEAREELQLALDNPNDYYKEPVATNLRAGHFVNYVIEQLQEKEYKNGEKFELADLQTGGYKVYTTLDYDLQQIAEKYVKLGVDQYASWRGGYNAALMTTHAPTGQVITMVGSRDFNGTRERCNDEGCKFDPKVNVLNTLQSAGSSMKMLGYYQAYADGVIYPGSIVPDVPIDFPGGYRPKNVDNRFWGFQTSGGRISTASNMLRYSRNLPALQVVDAIGVGKYVSTAQNFGYTSMNSSNTGLSVILGGTDVYPIEHVQAYSVFANGGDLVRNEVVLKIEDRDGNVVFEHQPEAERVGSPQGAYLLNASTNNQYGDISWDGRNVSGKTGTTQGQRDLIFMLYSPDFVTMGWVGNSDNSPLTASDAFGGTTVKPWVVQYMSDIGGSEYFSAKTAWERPGGITRGGGKCTDSDCTKAVGLESNWMIADQKPAPDQIYETYRVCTDQEDKLARQIDEELGKAKDKRFVTYVHFKEDLQQWWDKALGERNEFPTEQCDINRNPGGGEAPWSVLSSPSNGAILTPGGELTISGNAYTNAGNEIATIEFFFDDVSMGSVTQLSFNETRTVPTLPSGTYSFRAVTTDVEGLQSTAQVSVVVGSQLNSDLNITAPSGSVNYDGVNPINVTSSYTGPDTVTNIRLFVAVDGGPAQELGTLGAGGYDWSPPFNIGETKTYTLYLVASAGNTGTVQSNPITVDVTSL